MKTLATPARPSRTAPEIPTRLRPDQCRGSTSSATAIAFVALALAGCAAPPVEPYTPPPANQPAAELEMRLMPASRNRGVAVLVPGAVKCNPSRLTALVQGTVEEPPRVLATSRDGGFNPVVRLPAGDPLPLRFRYWGPGEEFVVDMLVVLLPGHRYVLEHEIPGYRVRLTDAQTGSPPLSLPVRLRWESLKCPA